MALLARAKSNHLLALLLAALLAWPSSVPVVITPSDEASTKLTASSDLLRPLGANFHRTVCPVDLDGHDCLILADDSEGSEGRDDLRYVLPTPPRCPLDLMSLIPTSLDVGPPGPRELPKAIPHSPPLRC